MPEDGGGPVICGYHEYVGFLPCPRCIALTALPREYRPVVGRVEVIADSSLAPWWIPDFVFRWMARVVSKTQRVAQKG